MQKKLISVAVAAAMGTGTAFVAETASADGVTVYGQFRQEIHHQDNGTNKGIRLDDSGSQSRVGIKASKDLGNGLKAVGVIEWIVELCGVSGGSGGGGPTANLTTGAVNTSHGGCRQDFATARQQFIGLQGGFGRLAFGRFNGSYKLHGGVKYDAFAATSLQARANGGQSGGGAGGGFVSNAFMDDVVEYKSPKLGMFTFMAQFGLDDGVGPGADDGNPAGAKADTLGDWNVAAKVGDKTWEVIAAASHDDDRDNDNVKIGGKVKFGPASVSLQFEDSDSGNAGPGTYVHGQVVYKVGKIDLVAGYGQFDDDAPGVGWADANHLAIGAKYHLGKKVWTWLGYAQTDRDDRANKTKNIGVGMHMSF